MNKTEAATLSFLCAALHGQTPADPGLEPEEWQKLLRLSERHKLLPLILDAAWSLPSCRAALSRHSRPSPEQNSKISGKPAHSSAEAHGVRPSEASASPAGHSERSEAEPKNPSSQPLDWRALVFDQVGRQAVQENEFLDLVLALRARGLEPVSVKGPALRALWPRPLLRPSLDDDILVSDDTVMEFHKAFLELGLRPDEPDLDPRQGQELCYRKPGSPLFIEMHRRLFDPDSQVFAAFNEPFADALSRTAAIRIQDVTLQTLAPTDHLLFLILHAFKHFLYSGIGLRVGADICLFARHYADELDMEYIKAQCAAFRCERFAAALFRIGETRLGIPAPAAFAALGADETALLADMLEAGLYGEDIDRLHSANITLNAAARGGLRKADGMRSALFPPASHLSGRYPWLKRRPWLLPAAWAARGTDYLLHRKRYGRQSPAASLRIGRERVRLLEEYGIL